MDPITMSFGMNLKNIREGAKMTQAQLGQLAKLDVSQISRIERGSSKPELDTIKRIAIALSCSTDDLIFDQGEREPTAELKLLFERVSQLPDDRKALVKEFLLAIIQRAEAQEMLSK